MFEWQFWSGDVEMRRLSNYGIACILVLSCGSAMAQTTGPGPEYPEAFKYCAGCHSVDPKVKRIGPHLAGIFGRKAGSAGRGGLAESGLQAAMDQGIVWDEAKLSAMLSGSFGPGMHSNRKDPAANKQVIEFLKTK